MTQPSPDPFWLGPIGVDVSKHQGSINWPAVRDAGYDFAIIKASEGKGYTDPKFKANWIGARAAGLIVGAYHFARVSKTPTIEADAFAEAEWFASLVAAQPGSQEMMLPPVLDIEWDKNADKVIPAADVVKWCQVFTSTIEQKLSRRPMIYTGYNFWRWRLLRTSVLANLPLWQVHYTSKTTPRAIPNWKWTFWQWSYTQPLPARAPTKVDANRFSGSIEELRKLASGHRPVIDPAAETISEALPSETGAAWTDKLLESLHSVMRAIKPPARNDT